MADMSRFSIEGPYDVPVEKIGWGKAVATSELGELWEEAGSELAWARGCYAFAIRAGKGFTPVYVGKATRSFRQECFALHKVHKLNTALLHYKKGTPVLFLVALERKQGKPNGRAISGVEKFLIQNALARNEQLLNVQNTKPTENFAILGVFRGGKGKPSNAARAFRQTMGL